MDGIAPEIKDFTARVNQHFRVKRAIFFGSRARKDHLKDSDYDIIIVSDDFAGIPFTDRISLLYKYWTAEEAVEPLCYTQEEFEKKARQIGVVAEAIKEGIEVTIEGETKKD